MFSLLMKPKPWIAASLLVAVSAFGFGRAQNKSCEKPCKKSCETPCEKPCPQPNPPTQLCEKKPDPCCPAWPVPVLNAAYNYPAAVKTRCPVDMNVDVSFIYWQPIQENMELGSDTSATVGGTSTSSVIQADTDYKPGFKVGLGGKFEDYDNWDLHAEYTWFHGTQSQNATASAGNTIQMVQGSPIIIEGDYTAVSQNWRLNMDIAELTLGRAHYVGTKFTVHPTFGMRGLWIRQQLNSNYTGGIAPQFSKTARSWAIGPQVGIDTNWAIWRGFRFFGNAEGDLLYTRYTTLSTQTVTNSPTNNTTSEDSYGTVRAHLDLELGLAWGFYMDCNKYYLDFSAGYGFQVFFDQNMFRNFSNTGTAAVYNSFTPNGNLYIQGMTLSAKLDF